MIRPPLILSISDNKGKVSSASLFFGRPGFFFGASFTTGSSAFFFRDMSMPSLKKYFTYHIVFVKVCKGFTTLPAL